MTSRIEIDISIENGSWPSETALQTQCEKVFEAAVEYIAEKAGQPLPDEPPELSVVFTDDAAIRKINAEWRSIDKPTNVLSFPAFPVTPGTMPGPMLGDIIVARETVEREAQELGKPFEDHLTHLMVHGFLHLFGYDHMNDADADQMESLETKILEVLGLPDPYEGSDLEMEP